VEVHVFVQAGAKAVDEGDCAYVQCCHVGHQEVVRAVSTASAGKSVGEDAAFQILLEV
jgi:hypothetical protein